MYTDFYGLIRAPFGTTPDADNLFLSPSHREALGSILYGIKERKGIVLVTGEVGVGKTTILRRYLQIAAPPEAVVSPSTENRPSLQSEYDVRPPADHDPPAVGGPTGQRGAG